MDGRKAGFTIVKVFKYVFSTMGSFLTNNISENTKALAQKNQN